LPEGFKENAAQGHTSIKLIKPHLVIEKYITKDTTDVS